MGDEYQVRDQNGERDQDQDEDEDFPFLNAVNELQVVHFLPGALQITVFCARALPKAVSLRSPDPYVIIRCGHMELRTKHDSHTRNPTWNKTFNPFLITDEGRVTFMIMHKDLFSEDEFLGGLSIELHKMVFAPKQHNKRVLFMKEGWPLAGPRIGLGNNRSRIWLRLAYCPNTQLHNTSWGRSYIEDPDAVHDYSDTEDDWHPPITESVSSSMGATDSQQGLSKEDEAEEYLAKIMPAVNEELFDVEDEGAGEEGAVLGPDGSPLIESAEVVELAKKSSLRPLVVKQLLELAGAKLLHGHGHGYGQADGRGGDDASSSGQPDTPEQVSSGYNTGATPALPLPAPPGPGPFLPPPAPPPPPPPPPTPAKPPPAPLFSSGTPATTPPPPPPGFTSGRIPPPPPPPPPGPRLTAATPPPSPVILPIGVFRGLKETGLEGVRRNIAVVRLFQAMRRTFQGTGARPVEMSRRVSATPGNDAASAGDLTAALKDNSAFHKQVQETVERQKLALSQLGAEVKAFSGLTMDEVAEYVRTVDDKLSDLCDNNEVEVLRHISDWPEARYDSMRELAGIMWLLQNIRAANDSFQLPQGATLQATIATIEKHFTLGARKLERLERESDALAKKLNEHRLPWSSAEIKRTARTSLRLVELYQDQCIQEAEHLAAKLEAEGRLSEDEHKRGFIVVFRAVRFAMKGQDLVGGLDAGVEERVSRLASLSEAFRPPPGFGAGDVI